MATEDEIENAGIDKDVVSTSDEVKKTATYIPENDTKIDDRINELINAKLAEASAAFTSKIDEITKQSESEISALKKQLEDKESEIKKQKDITAKIVLNSSFGKNPETTQDFDGVDFDSVNWDKQAAIYLKSIDSKLN